VGVVHFNKCPPLGLIIAPSTVAPKINTNECPPATKNDSPLFYYPILSNRKFIKNYKRDKTENPHHQTKIFYTNKKKRTFLNGSDCRISKAGYMTSAAAALGCRTCRSACPAPQLKLG
jgi:hypothetical protein